MLLTNASRTPAVGSAPRQLDGHRLRVAPAAGEVLPQRRRRVAQRGGRAARGTRIRSTAATTSASQPIPALNVNQPVVGSAEADESAAAGSASALQDAARSPRPGRAACRSARAKTLAEPPGTTARAGRTAGVVTAACHGAGTPARRDRGRRAAHPLQHAVDDLVDRAVAAVRHHQLDAVAHGLPRWPRRRARGSGSARTSSLSSLASACARTSRPAAVVVVALGLTTSSARTLRQRSPAYPRHRGSRRPPSTPPVTREHSGRSPVRAAGALVGLGTLAAGGVRRRARPAGRRDAAGLGYGAGRGRVLPAGRRSRSARSARALVTGRRWARTPAIVIQLLLLPVVYSLIGPSRQLVLGHRRPGPSWSAAFMLLISERSRAGRWATSGSSVDVAGRSRQDSGRAPRAPRRRAGTSSTRPSARRRATGRSRSTGAFQSSTAHSSRAQPALAHTAASRASSARPMPGAAVRGLDVEVLEVDPVHAPPGGEVEEPERAADDRGPPVLVGDPATCPYNAGDGPNSAVWSWSAVSWQCSGARSYSASSCTSATTASTSCRSTGRIPASSRLVPVVIRAVIRASAG